MGIRSCCGNRSASRAETESNAQLASVGEMVGEVVAKFSNGSGGCGGRQTLRDYSLPTGRFSRKSFSTSFSFRSFPIFRDLKIGRSVFDGDIFRTWAV